MKGRKKNLRLTIAGDSALTALCQSTLEGLGKLIRT